MPSLLNECDLNYYRSRMAAELTLAARAGDAQVARAHRELAAKYSHLTADTPPSEDDFAALPPPVTGPRATAYAT